MGREVWGSCKRCLNIACTNTCLIRMALQGGVPANISIVNNLILDSPSNLPGQAPIRSYTQSCRILLAIQYLSQGLMASSQSGAVSNFYVCITAAKEVEK